MIIVGTVGHYTACPEERQVLNLVLKHLKRDRSGIHAGTTFLLLHNGLVGGVY